MITAVESFCKRLKIKFCEELVPYYEKGVKLKEALGNFILDAERLTRLNDKYHFFRIHFDKVLEAAKAVGEDEDLLLHSYILLGMIKEDTTLSILEMPNRNRIETDFSPLFALLYFLEDMIGNMERRKVPYSVISDTLNGFETEMNDYYDIYGRYGMRTYVNWFMHWVRGEIIRVGRLQFEFKRLLEKIRVYRKDDDVRILIDGEYMHEKGMVFGSLGQDDEAGKYFADLVEENGRVTGYVVNELGECTGQKVVLEGYEEKLRCGDKVLAVHIVSHEPFTKELCDASYEQVIEVMKKCYPEFEYKAIICNSWMLEKRLRQIMGRDTNITRFAERYHIYPTISRGYGVYSFLFHVPYSAMMQKTPEKLPENNSMQRAVKKYLCEGNYFYEKCGLILVP